MRAHYAFVKISLQGNVDVDQIQVLETVELGSAVRLNSITDFGQRRFELGRVDLPNKKVYGPMVMSLHATFNEGDTAGEILFAGAGVSFEEKS